MYLYAIQRWLNLLESIRAALGIHSSGGGPDWWLCFGLGLALALPAAVASQLYRKYTRYWCHRLQGFWQTRKLPRCAKIEPLKDRLDEGDLRRKAEYLRALRQAEFWRERDIPDPGETRESCERAAEAVLAQLEKHISRRAIELGLVVGVSSSRLIDRFAIAAAALEIQLEVMTRLGKQPSLAAWKQTINRAAASLMLNTFLTTDQWYGLRNEIRALGMGLEQAADWGEHALNAIGDHLRDIDWDDVLDHMPKEPVVDVKAILQVAGTVGAGMVTVGAAGLRQMGNFIERAGDELAQGAVAGGVLYFHGMELAAECLALDKGHKQSAAMTRMFSQCLAESARAAGGMLRDGVRELRSVLRKRRRMAAKLALDQAKHALAFAHEKTTAAAKAVKSGVSNLGDHVGRASNATLSTIGDAVEHTKNASLRILKPTT